MPQIVEPRTSLGSRPSAIPLGHRCSAVTMSGSSSMKPSSSSFWISLRVTSGSWFALVQFSWHTMRSGYSDEVLLLGSHNPTGWSCEKAPEGIPSWSKVAIFGSGSSEMRSSEWRSLSRNGWWSGIDISSEAEGKQSWVSWRKGRMSSSVRKGSDWWRLHASTTLMCSLVWRIRLIHVCRKDLKESFERGMVQFAELMSPAPSVIRGPLVIGFLVNKVLHVDKSWLISEDWETQGEMMLMMAEAKADGYSAVSALIKVPSGSLFPLKSMWSQCEQWPAKLEIRSDVAAMAQYLKKSSPHLHAGVATK